MKREFRFRLINKDGEAKSALSSKFGSFKAAHKDAYKDHNLNMFWQAQGLLIEIVELKNVKKEL